MKYNSFLNKYINGRAWALPLFLGVILCSYSINAHADEQPQSLSAAITTNTQVSESQSVSEIEQLITQKDYKKAIKYGEKAYKRVQNSKIALYLGKGYFLIQDYQNAFKYFKLAANNGESLAMLTLGNMYGSGIGVTQDMNQAVFWYQQAIKLDNVQAMNYLGLIYRDGVNGVTKNPLEAIRLFNLAALKHDAKGYFNLGYMYQNGIGIKVDYNTAIGYYTQAANLGDVYAMDNLGMIYNKGMGVSIDNQKALKWYTLAAAKGDANAACNIGVIYFEGTNGVDKNYELAKSWLILGQKSGCSKASNYLKVIDMPLPATNDKSVPVPH